jgi:hypothetical protein
MKKSLYILIAICLIVFKSCAVDEKSNEPFSIKIERESEIISFKEVFIITQDSIKINKSDFQKATTHSLKLPQETQQELLKILSNTKWNNLDSNYIKTIDDGTTFTFSILFKNQSKKIMVHYVKVEELFSLAEVLDALLPPEFKIGYDKKYLKY